MKNEIQLRKCPKCGKLFSERGAVSRLDNVTIIYSDCGTREVLESIGVDEKEQEKIITIGKPLKLSPAFPPLHTEHATFAALGVPSIIEIFKCL